MFHLIASKYILSPRGSSRCNPTYLIRLKKSKSSFSAICHWRRICCTWICHGANTHSSSRDFTKSFQYGTKQSSCIPLGLRRYRSNDTLGSSGYETSDKDKEQTEGSYFIRQPAIDFSVSDKLDHHIFVEDSFFEQLAQGSATVPLSQLQLALRKCGLRMTDPRLAESMAEMNRVEQEANALHDYNPQLDMQMFRKCICDNIVLIKAALTGNLVIPEFEEFCQVINGLYDHCRRYTDGKVANYIPQLSKYSPDYWGVSLCTVDGQRHSIGDVDVPFTMQSSGKPINYALAINELGEKIVHQYVGYEPSGESFNKLKLSAANKPHNPLINAGAIVVASLLCRGQPLAERFEYVIDQYKKVIGGEFIGFNNSIFLSEKQCGNRNYALGYYMKENGCFPEGTDLHETMDLYFQLCAIESNADSAAVMAASLANGGFCPITGDQVFEPSSVRDTLSLMHSCGMYDYSGRFAFRVGLPAKSGVSGVILLVVPNLMGMCLWSPALDVLGNSVRGLRFCKKLISEFSFHHYDNLKHTAKKPDPRLRDTDIRSEAVVKLLFGASIGDLSALRRLAMSGQDLTIADYDGRTALHVAACEGHLECVRFLVENCKVSLTAKDRWGRTAQEDATQFNKTAVADYLLSKTNESLTF